ncbi:deaminase/reductase [Microbacterium mangrovi]|uniref:Deaminase/reductase n=1 Tax=Microbacterium mangrovi TaxID=1348253 RepID=A0A0B1ZYU7_9MICO|nr:dihydrofolate reductase family protein [Microbacterium mangrovi]KHK96385.1 deaminase/reductase [Microbacterium mangrovi]
MPRKIVLYELLSLDGVAEDPDAFVTEWDAALDANLGSVIATQDAVLLGRRSYEEWARFWPTSTIEPFASFINAVDKHVASATPLEPAWANSQRIAEDPVDFARRLKDAPGGDIGVHASISLARSLLAAGLVDEIRLVIAPRVAGRGRHLLDELPPIRLETLRVEPSPAGYLLVDYRVVG